MELPRDLKLLIFDFDGTLHALDLDWAAVRHAVGIDQSGESLGEAIERFKRENDARSLQVITDMEIRAVDNLAFAARITDTLKKLQSKYQLAILSRNSRLAVEYMLQNSHLSGIFVIGREDVTRLKPDAEGVHKILDHFNAASDNTILVGDTSHDVVAAKNAGLASIIVGDNYQPSDELEPARTIKDFSELEQLLAHGLGR